MRSSFLQSAALAAVALPLAFSACTTLGPDDQATPEQRVGAAAAAKADAQKATTDAELEQSVSVRSDDSTAAASARLRSAYEVIWQSLR